MKEELDPASGSALEPAGSADPLDSLLPQPEYAPLLGGRKYIPRGPQKRVLKPRAAEAAEAASPSGHYRPQATTTELTPEAAAAWMQQAPADIRKKASSLRKRDRKRSDAVSSQVAKLNQRSREVALTAYQEGLTPLQVMLSNMRRAQSLADACARQLMEADQMPTLEQQMVELKMRDIATGWAVDAAPYVHARLAPRMEKGQTGPRVTLVIEEA